MNDIPNGFAPLRRSSPFAEANGPFYCKDENGALIFGIRIEARHCNSGGTVHGGLIATICDLALGRNIGLASASPESLAKWRHEQAASSLPVRKLVTINLSTDYAGYAKVGDWIEVRVEVQKIGKALAFANAYVFRGSEKIARSSAVFRDLGDE
jgi:acyl-coenzyme A thioesterase PaaI-like protein